MSATEVKFRGLIILLWPVYWLQAQTFVKVSQAGIFTTVADSRCVNWVDYNSDGHTDLFLTNGPAAGQNNRLYKNNGNGTFSLVTGDPIVSDNMPSDGATWADVDNDGDEDCFVANWYNKNNLFYLNNGNGTFKQMTTPFLTTDGGYSETASWGDYDRDGLVDLLVTNSAGNKKNFIYHNKGHAVFTKLTSGSLATDANDSRGINWCDLDNNGYPDALVTNESSQDEDVYLNQGNGSFTKLGLDHLVLNSGNTMGSACADYDNDGDLDVYLANHNGYGCLFNNDGLANFTKLMADTISKVFTHGFGSAWGDIDNDGDEDLFVSNGYSPLPETNLLFINNGDGTFTRDSQNAVTQDAGWWFGCAFGDYDNDGSLDLAVANCHQGNGKSILYRNQGNANNWLKIKCTGTISNRSAIGARVKVKTRINGVNTWQMREISAQSGYNGQNMLVAHFGISQALKADTILVYWPSGLIDRYTDVEKNQLITLLEGQQLTSLAKQSQTPVNSLANYPNPFSAVTEFTFSIQNTAQVNLSIYDVRGTLVKTLVDTKMEPGLKTISWNSNEGETKLNDGIYVGVLKINEKQQVKKLLYIDQ